MKELLRLGIVAIIFSILFAVGMQVNAENTNFSDEELINQLMIDNEDNPESTEYLVTDNFISRVLSETTVSNFKENFSNGEVVKVYEDKACTKEVENGYVSSGMYAKYEINGRVFEIAVLGDINSTDKEENNISGDGILNQIELTRTIRGYIETAGWEIKDNVELQSADVTCDKSVNLQDINSMITYIVFGGIQTDNVKKVESPKVEIIEGRKNEDGKYINSVKVKITQTNKEDETLKTVYKITGTKTAEYKKIDAAEEVIELNEKGIYKVTAYTYGILENKSKGSSEIIEIINGEVAYKVEHYKEDLKASQTDETTYTLVDTDNLTGVIGETVTAVAKEYKGFTEDKENTQRIAEGTVVQDGSLTLKIYYSRNTYKITLNKNDNIEKVILDEKNEGDTVYDNYKYEQIVNINAILKNQEGYKFTWDKWIVNGITITEASQKQNIKMPAQDIVLTANGTKEKISYNITYELNGGTNSSKNPSTYTVEDTINLEPATKEGYTFAGWYENAEFSGNKTTTIENRKGEITLYAQWKDLYTVTFYDEKGENILDEVEVKYGEEAKYTKEIQEDKTENGIPYKFIGWYTSIDLDAKEADLSNIVASKNVYARYISDYFVTKDENKEEKTLTISGVNDQYNSPIDIYIPSTYNGYAVKAIDNYNSQLIGILNVINLEIADGIEYIGSHAFANCDNLKNIKLPQGITRIEDRVFYGCATLSNIEIPNSVTNIGEGAFDACPNLESINIPNSVTDIGSSAFSYCVKLKSIELPQGITRIESKVFYNCETLSNIEIPNSITYIGASAFSGCSNLESINIPNSVTDIEESAFFNCIMLKSINIPNSVTNIGEKAFYGCVYLESIKLSQSITSIENRTFYDCINIRSIEIPNSVTNIGESAFDSCMNLESINIPNSVINIGEFAFSNCRELISINIPNSVTDIGIGAFYACFKLESIEVDGENNNYTSVEGVLFDKNMEKIIEYPKKKLSAEYTIPSSVTYIEDYAFDLCEIFTINIPNGVTYIGRSAFHHCIYLETIIYHGTREQFRKIEIGTNNEKLAEENITFTEE